MNGTDADADDYIYYYKKLKNDIKNGDIDETKQIIITTYDSLNVIMNHIKQPNYIIIDEFKNVMTRTIHIQDQKLTGKLKAELINNLFILLNNSDAFYLLDADYDKDIHKYLKTFITRNFTAYFLNNHIKPHKVIVRNLLMAEIDLFNDLINGKNLVIPTNSRGYGKKLYDDIREKLPHIKMLFIDKNGATHSINGGLYENLELKENIIKNTDLWSDYNVVIYTPTITTGISYNNRNHFYKTYIYINTLTTDPTQTAQFTYRVRHTETNEIIAMTTSISHLKKPQEYNDYIDHASLNKINNKNHAEMIKYDEVIKRLIIYKENGDIEQIENLIDEINRQEKQQDTRLFIELYMIEMKKTHDRNNQFIYCYLKKMIEWGVNIENINITGNTNTITLQEFKKLKNELYDKIISLYDEPQLTDDDIKIDFLKSNYIEDIDDYRNLLKKYENDGDDTQEYINFKYTTLLKRAGITYIDYIENKDLIEENIKNIDYYLLKPFEKFKTLRGYSYKNAIKFIIKNMKPEHTFMREVIRHKKINHKQFYLTLFKTHFLFEFLDIFNIKLNEADFNKLTHGVEIEKTDIIKSKITDLINDNYKLFEFIINNEEHNRHTTEINYKNIKYLIKSTFEIANINFNYGKEKPRDKKERMMTIKATDYNIRWGNIDDEIEPTPIKFNNKKPNSFFILNGIIKNRKTGEKYLQMGEILLNNKDYIKLNEIIENINNEGEMTGKCLINHFIEKTDDATHTAPTKKTENQNKLLNMNGIKTAEIIKIGKIKNKSIIQFLQK